MPAAALVGEEPARLQQVVELLQRFRGHDFGSLRVVEPLALFVSAEKLFEIAERVKRRRQVRDEVALLVHLLRIEISEQRNLEQQAAAAAVVALEQAREQVKRDDPERYLRRLMSLPYVAEPEFVESFLSSYVADPDEAVRLHSLAEELRAESAEKKIERWIRSLAEQAPEEIDLAIAHEMLAGFLDELPYALDAAGLSSYHELVEEMAAAVPPASDREADAA